MPDIGEITVISSNLRSRARQAAPAAAWGRAALTTGSVALAAAALAACSGSSGPGATSSTPAAATSAPATSAAPATSSPAAAGSSGTAAGGLNVCSSLTEAQVASITHDVVELAAPTNAGGISACAYALSNTIVTAQVAPSGSSVGWTGFSELVSQEAKPAGSATPVPGLGQQAVSSSAGVAVMGTKYDYLILNAKGQAANQLSDDVAMARVLLKALG
jgi:hypothetical protein